MIEAITELTGNLAVLLWNNLTLLILLGVGLYLTLRLHFAVNIF